MVEWLLKKGDGTGMKGVSENGAIFDIELEDGEYYGADDDGNEISVTNIETRIVRIK